MQFDFMRLREYVHESVKTSRQKARVITDHAVRKLTALVSSHHLSLRHHANSEATQTNAVLVKGACDKWAEAWDSLASTYQKYLLGVPYIDMSFDEDAFCKVYHDKFPLKLNFPWPGFVVQSVGPGGVPLTLEQQLTYKKIQFDCPSSAQLQELFKNNVDTYDEREDGK